jgi:hypothetical protein
MPYLTRRETRERWCGNGQLGDGRMAHSTCVLWPTALVIFYFLGSRHREMRVISQHPLTDILQTFVSIHDYELRKMSWGINDSILDIRVWIMMRLRSGNSPNHDYFLLVAFLRRSMPAIVLLLHMQILIGPKRDNVIYHHYVGNR